jgi:hypothetical protein
MGRVWALYYILIIEDAVRQSLVDDNYDYRAETVAFAPSSHPASNGPAFCLTCACLAVYLPVYLSECPACLHAWLPAFLLRNAACFYLICQFSPPLKISLFFLLYRIFYFLYFLLIFFPLSWFLYLTAIFGH